MSAAHSRMTRQREVILQELRGVTSHPTADDVYEMVRAKLPRISLGTVYRNLEMLAETGIIQKLEVSGTQRRFDGNPDTHDHIRCSVCGRVDDLPSNSRVVLDERARIQSGYRIEGYRIEFVGTCPQCAAAGITREGN